jgi:seryl-tRNA synthetase
VAQKREIDSQVEAQKKATKEFEVTMRQKASTVGNIVGKDVPVSLTEVCSISGSVTRWSQIFQDDNATLRTWHPKGPDVEVEQRKDIMPHHEVLLRLDAMDLDRGMSTSPQPRPTPFTVL